MTDTNKCAGCFKKIRCRYLVRALDKNWHERCLRCDVCDEILFSFGSRMYFKHEGKFCKMDYMRYVSRLSHDTQYKPFLYNKDYIILDYITYVIYLHVCCYNTVRMRYLLTIRTITHTRYCT